MKNYKVWRSQFVRGRADIGGGYTTQWFPCNHIIKARSDKEALSKMVRKFAKYGFKSMSLVAVPVGINPNDRTS